MLIHFETDKLNDYGLDLGSVLLVLADIFEINLEQSAKQLIEFREAESSITGNFNIETTDVIRSRVNALMQDSTPTKSADDKLLECAAKLKDIYPKGCVLGKTGTKYPYAESPQLIVRRLKLFFRKYGEFPLDDIVEATRKYIKDEWGSPYFKTLKYFICQEKNIAGMIESESKLLNYLEVSDDMQVHESDEQFVNMV